jgi:hypothetical protein
VAGLGGRGGESEIVAGQAWDALRRALAAGGGAASPGLRPVLVRLLAVARPPGVVGSEAQRLMESLHEQLTDAAIPDAAGLAAAWRLVQRLERVTALPAPVVAERALADAPAAPREVELEEEEASVGIPLDAPLVDAGVDDDLAAELAAAGVATLHDLLTLVPAHEVSLAPVIGAGRPMPDGAVAVGGRVRARVTTCLPDGGLFAAVHLHGAGPATVGWSGPAAGRGPRSVGGRREGRRHSGAPRWWPADGGPLGPLRWRAGVEGGVRAPGRSRRARGARGRARGAAARRGADACRPGGSLRCSAHRLGVGRGGGARAALPRSRGGASRCTSSRCTSSLAAGRGSSPEGSAA